MGHIEKVTSVQDDAMCGIEQTFLGILLASPKHIKEVMHLLTPEMFLHQLHGQIFEVMALESKAGRRHDIRTIQPLLNDALFAGTTKHQYMVDLYEGSLSPLFAKEYAERIRDYYNDRRIQFLVNSSLPEKKKAAEISSLWREIGSLQDSGDVVTLKTIMEETHADIIDTYRRNGALAGLSTGLKDLDDELCGFEPGCLYVIAGRPAMGKSALAITIALNVAQAGHPVLFFSLEMMEKQIGHRLNARYANVGIKSQKNGNGLESSDFMRLEETKLSLANVPFSVVRKRGINVEQIIARARDASRQQPQKLIVIDHLGIIAPTDVKQQPVHQIAHITRSLKVMAEEMNVPILLLHQLSRGVESRDDKRPFMSDLRDSGSVEQDADAVMLLYREEYYLQGREPDTSNFEAWNKWENKRIAAMNKADLNIAKNRQGEVRTIKLYFNPSRQVFENLGE